VQRKSELRGLLFKCRHEKGAYMAKDLRGPVHAGEVICTRDRKK